MQRHARNCTFDWMKRFQLEAAESELQQEMKAKLYSRAGFDKTSDVDDLNTKIANLNSEIAQLEQRASDANGTARNCTFGTG